jgi:hypothetical protein
MTLAPTPSTHDLEQNYGENTHGVRTVQGHIQRGRLPVFYRDLYRTRCSSLYGTFYANLGSCVDSGADSGVMEGTAGDDDFLHGYV